MRQRSNLIILFGIAFFLVGGAIVYLVLNDDDDGGSSASADGVPQVSILVAAADIPANTIGADAIEQGLLTTEQMDSDAQPSGALTSADLLLNRIFAVDVAEGSAITNAQLATRSVANIPVPEGFDGVAVTVDYTPGGAGYIAPGDTVNVYGVYGAGATTDGGLTSALEADGVRLPRTELALTNVRVLDVSDQQATAAQAAATTPTTQPGAVQRPSETQRPITYLLALRPSDAERIIHLSENAGIYLALTADDAAPVGDTPGVSGDNVNDPVSADSAAPQS